MSEHTERDDIIGFRDGSPIRRHPDSTDMDMEIEIVDVHYELEYRWDEDQPWTTELSQIEWVDPSAAEAWAVKNRPDREHRIVKVERTPL